MASLQITTELQQAGPAAAIVLDDAQVASLGADRKNPPVTVTIDGHTERLRVARMGGANLIGLRKEVRVAFGVEAGDTVTATIALDTAERTVDVPPELAAALDANPAARDAFEKLPYTHRREHAQAIADAKKPETKARRVAKTIEMLTGA